ncbi:MAG: hypothetical protein JXR76_04530 [Deltaproteobacteria bacterium]|nr:hypothetical protein [Deltaproteobacteria bacterium]
MRMTKLSEGDYYFQVTDPSGKVLLSTDHISARRVHVNDAGVIDKYLGRNYECIHSGPLWAWEAVDNVGVHEVGVDVDHSKLGAITVQLYPFDDTPNPGGVYKVWMTPVEMYNPVNPVLEPVPGNSCKGLSVNGEGYVPGNYHGFIPAWSKTDNFKVKDKHINVEPPEITVRKFHDKNMNCVWDEGEEEEVIGWTVNYVTTVDGGSDYTPFTIVAAEPGDFIFTEDIPVGVIQTVAILDGQNASCRLEDVTASPDVNVSITADFSRKATQELHELIYGNFGTGSVTVKKVYDRNANGIDDEGEPGVPGWKFTLKRIAPDEAVVWSTELTAGSDGVAVYNGLLPGSYTVTEIIPEVGGWIATGETSQSFDVVSTLTYTDDGPVIAGSSSEVVFTNYLLSHADFGTKGYWHNRNGLGEITDVYINHVNKLVPYSSPTSYFDAGDEPFDGVYSDGTPVDAAYNNEKITDGIAAGEGEAGAEISHFLTDSNGGGDPAEQLAQQLLAFLFNVQYRLGEAGTTFMFNGTLYTADDLISDAIHIWLYGTDTEKNDMKDLLDSMNNTDDLVFIPHTPSTPVYTP